MRLTILLLWLTLVATGCLTSGKVARWNREHPELAARYCADNFPPAIGDTVVSTRIDSADYIKYLDELQQSVLALNSVNDSLLLALTDKDTTQDSRASFAAYIDYTNNLVKRLLNTPPKIVYQDKLIPIRDSADAQAIRLENTRLQGTVQNQKEKILELQGKVKTRLWIIIALSLLVALAIVGIIYKK